MKLEDIEKRIPFVERLLRVSREGLTQKAFDDFSRLSDDIEADGLEVNEIMLLCKYVIDNWDKV